MARTGTVYGLFEADTGALRYVGGTTQSLAARLRGHWKRVRAGEPAAVFAWMRKMRAEGRRIETAPLEEGLPKSALHAEEQWAIAYYRAIGCDLTNERMGGEANGRMSAKMRRRASEASKAAWVDPEFRARMAAHARSQMEDPEMRAKLAKEAKRRWRDPEMRARYEAAARQRWDTPEAREMLRQAHARATGRAVVDQNGTRYESMAAAARACGVRVSHIHQQLTGRCKQAKGYVFRYADEGSNG